MSSIAEISFFQPDGSPISPSIVDRYPGGEFRVAVAVESGDDQIALVRGANPATLVILAVWANNVRRLGGNPIGFVPYLPAARADHDDHPHGFDAAAYARLLNAAELDRVVCVDPHSLVMPGLVENCEIIDAAELVEDAVREILPSLAGLISPDEGAQDRVQRVADRLSVPTFQARKHRDFDSGELCGFSCETLPADGAFLVVDDICDGGGTFRGLANVAGVGRDRLHLWVTHGIFSGHAYPTLLEDYSTVSTTDSHPGSGWFPDARVVELLPYLLKHISRD